MSNVKTINQKLFILVLLLFLFLSPVSVWAICEGPIVPCGTEWIDNPNPPPERICTNPCQFCHIFELLNNIINYVLTCLTPIVAGFMMVLGGFYFLIAGPSPEKVSKAQSVITAAVIGLVIIFLSWVFLNTFLDMIGVAKWTGFFDNPATPEKEGWWQIQCP